MEREGVIVGYKALINYEKTTTQIGSLILVNLAEVIPRRGHIPKRNILNVMKKFEEIEEIVEVQATNFDLAIRARFQSLRKLSAFIEELRSMEGIEETSSAIITEEKILPPPPLFRESALV